MHMPPVALRVDLRNDQQRIGIASIRHPPAQRLDIRPHRYPIELGNSVGKCCESVGPVADAPTTNARARTPIRLFERAERIDRSTPDAKSPLFGQRIRNRTVCPHPNYQGGFTQLGACDNGMCCFI
jgi:hypothetical protein